MSRDNGKTSIEVFITDRDRVNALAVELTGRGAGRFGQAETIRWLLQVREQIIEGAISDYAAELAS